MNFEVDSHRSLPSDFAVKAATRSSAIRDKQMQFGGIVFSTFTLGFIEGCGHVERRPIPLRFALKYAACNVLPSCIWQGVSPSTVYTSLRNPPERMELFKPLSSLSAASATPNRARRTLWLTSVRSMRCIMGSYGLMYGMWSLYNAKVAQEDVLEDEEYVLRLASPDSAVSKVSKRRHLNHILCMDPWKSGVEYSVHELWHRLGLHLNAKNAMQRLTDRTSIVEFEVSSEEDAANARALLRQMRKESNSIVQGVVVIPLDATDVFTSSLRTFGVYVNALAGLTKYLLALCEQESLSNVFVLSNSNEHKELPDRLVHALQHDTRIYTTSVELNSTELQDQSDGLSVILARNEKEGMATVQQLIDSGVTTRDKILLVTLESLHTSKTLGLPLSLPTRSSTSNVFKWSSADYCDAALQEVRQLVRDHKPLPAIQNAIFKTYGIQTTCARRPNAYSDISEYI